MPATEFNFDGIVGPTHNYAGLSLGNVASMTHRGATSNPRAAALQGLAKMKFLADLGIAQAVLPPHPRPAVDALRALGFTGNEAAILRTAARDAPELLRACASSSSMWVANAATVSPSRDTRDRRVHFTPANLVSKLHRSLEPAQTERTLRAIFRDPGRFIIHDPVPGGQGLGDEGAANHTRLAPTHGHRGLHLFAYGHEVFGRTAPGGGPRRFPSRQAREASEAIVRRHGLRATDVVYAQLHPDAIDAGVFHHDVIAVGNEGLFLYHEQAYANARHALGALRRAYAGLHGGAELAAVMVPRADVSLADAVGSYLFNSQLVTLPSGRMALIAPAECRESPGVQRYLESLVAGGGTPVQQVHYVDLRQSMRNGGGPACLRLRVVLTPKEAEALPPQVRLTAQTHEALVAWVKKHYREQLRARDLADPHLVEESRRALDKLTQLLGLGSIYSFQE